MRGAALLTEADPPAVTVLNRGLRGPFLFTCDHACNRIPSELGSLGMAPDQLSSHIGWDPGALPVAQALAARFQSPLIHGGYSRLVVDLNRPPESADSMPTTSAGVAVPGNIGLSKLDRERRLDALFHPYHETIDALIGERRRLLRPTILIALHSFTPDYPGETRPWHIGVIYRRDGGLGSALFQALHASKHVRVGDNQPFQIQDEGDVTIPRHGEAHGLPNVLIELRQDTLASPAQREAWVDRLYRALAQAADSLSGGLDSSPAKESAP